MALCAAAIRRVVLLLALCPIVAATAHAFEIPADLIVTPRMLMALLGGLALFLYGLDRVGEGLRAAAGNRIKELLASLTGNRFIGAATGAFVTAVIQSSAITTTLVVGFVSAGVMTLGQSVGVIMGANIGTTITAQIIAFRITDYALLLVATGFVAGHFARHERLRHAGTVIFGLGLIFFGMHIMGETLAPLRSHPRFPHLMQEMAHPVVGILCGALFTALVQSSSVTSGIIVVMAGQGLISLPAGIAVALGANIGSCVTALLACIGKPRAALRAAGVHVLFNIVGVLIWVGWIEQLAALAVGLSPRHPELAGLDRLAAEAPRQIANANTLFNVANTALFIGLTEPIARFVTWLLPDRPVADKAIIKPKFIDDRLVTTPAIALNLARLEVGHLGEQVLLMLPLAQHALRDRDEFLLRELVKLDDSVDILHSRINAYLNRIGKQTLTEAESRDYFRISQANAYLEGIGDILETDLAALGHDFIQMRLQPSTDMTLLLDELFRLTHLGVEKTVETIRENDPALAQDVLVLRGEIERCAQEALKRQAQSLAESSEARLETLNAEFELIDRLKRIYSLSKRVARLWLPKEEAGQDRD